MKDMIRSRAHRGCVYIIGGEDIRRSLSGVLEARRIANMTYASAEDFLTRGHIARPACAVVDVSTAGPSSLHLQHTLLAGGLHLPLIFIVDHGDVRTAVRALKKGAVGFLEKPVRSRHLAQVVKQTLHREEEDCAVSLRHFQATVYLQLLSTGERQVVDLIVTGNPTGQIAKRLGFSTRIVEGLRASLMDKLQARSREELSQIVLFVKGFGRSDHSRNM